MTGVSLTIQADTSRLEKAIFRILAFGRRTMQEQCVTSATFIALRAQKLMPATDIGRIDVELEVEVSPVLATRGKRKGMPLKSGKKTVALQKGARVPLAVLIVMARGNPTSNFSRLTGNRWPAAKLPTGPGTAAARQAMIGAQIQRMTMSRHSSSHFLQTGWSPAIRAGLASPFFKYNPAFGSRKAARSFPNTGNKVSVDDLGTLTIDLSGENCIVTVANNAGEPVGKSNDTLANKHRRALIEYGAPALQQAIDEEAANIEREVQRRLDAGWKVKFPELL